MTEIQERLFELRDEKIRDYSASLMPTVDKNRVIGIRTPDVRKLAKELSGTEMAERFLDSLPHEYFEENQLHAALISVMRDYNEIIRRLDEFLPYCESWATTDMINPAAFKKHRDDLYRHAYRWIDSGDTYPVRYGILCLMNHYLEDEFNRRYPEKVALIESKEYYVNMMRAWYFATALAKKWDEIFPIIEGNRLDKWTHNKAIQKSIESYRISVEQKSILKSLKR